MSEQAEATVPLRTRGEAPHHGPAGPNANRERATRKDAPPHPQVQTEPTPPASLSPFDILAYQRDVLERSILFLDTLRKRADAMLEHEQAGLPPLLSFKYETLLDARQLEPPANYALLRITQVGEKCWDDCVDPTKAPVIILDPRAGHGPGIGGFKRGSEVGIALHVGHPVYFVVFFPEPCPHQSLGDVLAALRIFVDEVAKRHAGKAPILYGEHAFATTYGADTSLSSLAPLLWWNRWVTGTSSPRRNRW